MQICLKSQKYDLINNLLDVPITTLLRFLIYAQNKDRLTLVLKTPLYSGDTSPMSKENGVKGIICI